ncbi:MAG: DUF533 domain-containing protein [Pseudomonadota bacterium]
MSLMKTLAKVAVGVAVAKGAQKMMQPRAGGSPGGGLGGLLGGLAGAAPAAGGTAGLQDMLGGLLGGQNQAGLGGLGGLLEGLGGAGQAGGLGAALGGLAGGAGAGGLLGGLAGALGGRPQQEQASFGAVLNSQFDQTPEPPIAPSADQEAAAALMLRAMIQAAKSDGQIDQAEEEKLMGQLGGDIDAEEAAFLRGEMQRAPDPAALARETPAALAPQVYAMSVIAIDLDSRGEAQHLHTLAQGLNMTPAQVNDIHSQLGVPSLYT